MDLRKLIDKSLDKADREQELLELQSEIKNYPYSALPGILDMRSEHWKMLYERYQQEHARNAL